MQVFIIALMCLINLVLWLVFFLKFKQLFSTEDVIKKTRDQLELLLNDVNRNALQNIDLIDMKIEELNSLIEVADRRLSTVQNEVEFIQKKNSYQLEASKPRNARRTAQTQSVASEIVEGEKAFKLELDSKKGKRKTQAELFESELSNTRKAVRKSSASKTVLKTNSETQENNSQPRIYMSPNPIQQKKSFKDEVTRLYNAGYTVDQIAHELNKSTTEVELIVAML